MVPLQIFFRFVVVQSLPCAVAGFCTIFRGNSTALTDFHVFKLKLVLAFFVSSAQSEAPS